jgi:hypothetical protein
MDTYSDPVASLLRLGRPQGHIADGDYPPYHLGPEHIPELIRLMQDQEIAFGEEPECYAEIHAWRALAQLRAEEAVGPLLDHLAWNAAQEDDWLDWIGEEVPIALAMIGPHVLPIIVERLKGCRSHERVVGDYGKVLRSIAERWPETRAETIAHLSSILDRAGENNPDVNGFIIADLIALKAVETWPTIERAFATGNVDEMILGGVADAKWRMGLGPEPPHLAPVGFFKPLHQDSNAKQRFDERMRKKKAEKKKRKAERKRK